MMRSLYSGVSGLSVHQTKMDVIGNNIANVNTVGYKAQRVSFSELFYQTTAIASGPSEDGTTGGTNAMQIGLGSSISQISVNVTERGGAQSTGNAFDVMINGDSFFIIENGGTQYYSKAGNFTTDGFGNLVTPSGGYVMGYTAAKNEETGDFYLQNDKLRPISLYGNEYMTTAPAQSTEATIVGNINAEDASFAVDGSGMVATTLYLYDSLGNKYGVDFHITQISATEYSLTPATVYLGTEALEGVTAVLTGAEGAAGEAGSLTVTFDGTKGTVTNEPGSFTLNLTDAEGNLPSFSEDITVDFSQLTCYGSTTTLTADAGSLDNQGAGKAVGNMISLGIGQDGSVIASYSNGDTVTIGQLMTAQFSNASGLEKVGDNLFATTLNSGTTTIQTIDASGQSMSSGVVEMSNVDLASEFTDMIVTQRGFQANSRVITTSDSMIEELLSLKR